MAEIITIDDPADPRVAEYIGLTDAELRRSVERPDGVGGVFIVEGALALRRLLTSTYEVRSVLVTPTRSEALADDIARIDAPVYVASQTVMDAVTGFHIHRGVLAAGVRRPLPALSRLLVQARAVAVLEGINDHENMGALFRNAAALGVDGVVLCPRCCDPLYRRSIRVSVGHVLSVPYARAGDWPAAIDDIRGHGFRVLALTPRPGAIPIGDAAAGVVDGVVDARVAVLLGAEGPGLSDGARSAADQLVRIPMAPGGDSLNVATAAAIAFHRLVGPRD